MKWERNHADSFIHSPRSGRALEPSSFISSARYAMIHWLLVQPGYRTQERVGAMIRVLIVDDDVSLRQLLAFMLEREPEFQLVAEAGTLAEARRVLQDADIAIVDMMLPDGSGTDLVGELRAANPGCRVLVLTSVVNRVLLARAMQAGAAGIVQKSARIGEIVDALRQLDRGEQLLSPAEASELQRLVDEPQE